MHNENMKICPTKTKTMLISRQTMCHNLNVRNRDIEEVVIFKYLGAVFSVVFTDLNSMIQAASMLYGAINKKFLRIREVSKQTKLTVFWTVYAQH